jgi:hypothetical protein
VYFFIWSVRVKGWTFGFGAVLDAIGGGVGTVKGGVKKLFSREKDEEKAAVAEGAGGPGRVGEKN